MCPPYLQFVPFLHRTAKRLAVVVAAFITCWLPFFVSYVARPFHADHVIPASVYTFLTWLGNQTSVSCSDTMDAKACVIEDEVNRPYDEYPLPNGKREFTQPNLKV